MRIYLFNLPSTRSLPIDTTRQGPGFQAAAVVFVPTAGVADVALRPRFGSLAELSPPILIHLLY